MMHPLYHEFPELRESIPALEFAHLPTPVMHLPYSNGNSNQGLWVKRDDLSHSRYGGNKVRKLEFILAELLASGQSRLATFGAIGTNHGVATALFCQQYNIQCKVFLFDQPMSRTVLNNLRCMQALGAELVYCGSLLKTVLSFYQNRLFERDTYHLFAGGSNVAGCISFVNAAYELKAQIEQELCPEPDLIVCPVGSSATIAGLTLGCHLAGLKTKVKGVRVAPSHLGIFPACTPGTVTRLMHQTYHHLCNSSKEIPNLKLPEIDLEQGYYGNGYGSQTAKGVEAGTWFAEHGLTLEQTYTAKAAACVLDLVRQNTKRNLLYWHTFNSADLTHILAEADDCKLPIALRKPIMEFESSSAQ